MKWHSAIDYSLPFCSVALWALAAAMSKILTTGRTSAFAVNKDVALGFGQNLYQ
ncbi:MAG TPA: hypothetical protein H9687_00490 [Firmicutes bacterium]|nr:hypothetical protein [Bacillota bacterium]